MISKGHTKVLDKWLKDGAFVKFVGDNVDKQVNVRDIASDHHGKLMHMFSIFAVKARVSPPPAPIADLSRSMLPAIQRRHHCWSVEYCAITLRALRRRGWSLSTSHINTVKRWQ